MSFDDLLEFLGFLVQIALLSVACSIVVVAALVMLLTMLLLPFKLLFWTVS